jgi:hypothetical protein
MVEYWNNEMMGNTIISPVFHHSIIPSFRFSMGGSAALGPLWVNKGKEALC